MPLMLGDKLAYSHTLKAWNWNGFQLHGKNTVRL